MSVESQAKVKERLANQARNEEGAPAGAQSPAQPAKPEEGASQPVPAAAPAPVAPTPAPAAPGIDPAEHQRIQGELDKANTQIADFAKQSQAAGQEIAAFRMQEAKKMQLPSESELNEMSQGEAIARGAAATKAYVDASQRAVADDLRLNVIQPNEEKMGRIGRVTAETEANTVYPGMMGKYGPAMHNYMDSNPNTSAVQALKAVADPRDLSVALSAQPTTPGAVPETVAAHVDTGRPSNVQGTPAQPSSEQPTVRDKMQAAVKAREAGDFDGAKALRLEAIKDRLAPKAR